MCEDSSNHLENGFKDVGSLSWGPLFRRVVGTAEATLQVFALLGVFVRELEPFLKNRLENGSRDRAAARGGGGI